MIREVVLSNRVFRAKRSSAHFGVPHLDWVDADIPNEPLLGCSTPDANREVLFVQFDRGVFSHEVRRYMQRRLIEPAAPNRLLETADWVRCADSFEVFVVALGQTWTEDRGRRLACGLLKHGNHLGLGIAFADVSWQPRTYFAGER
jgi:hypothetical protein